MCVISLPSRFSFLSFFFSSSSSLFLSSLPSLVPLYSPRLSLSHSFPPSHFLFPSPSSSILIPTHFPLLTLSIHPLSLFFSSFLHLFCSSSSPSLFSSSPFTLSIFPHFFPPSHLPLLLSLSTFSISLSLPLQSFLPFPHPHFLSLPSPSPGSLPLSKLPHSLPLESVSRDYPG